MKKGNEIWIKKPGLGFLCAGYIAVAAGPNVASSLTVLCVSASLYAEMFPSLNLAEVENKGS